MKKMIMLITVALLCSVVSLYAQTAQTNLDNGKRRVDQGNYEGAIQYLNEAIRLDPNLAEAYDYRARSYNYKNEYDMAISDTNKAIQLNPNLATSYHSRAYAYNKKGDTDRAIADFTEAIRLDPNYVNAYNSRGVIYANMNDYNRAISDFESALRIDPNNSLAKKNLDLAKSVVNKATEAANEAAKKEAEFNPNGLDRSKYKEIKVEDFSFDMVAGKLSVGTKVAFRANFFSKPTGTTYRFEDVNADITLSTTHNFVRDMPDRCFGPYKDFFLGWQTKSDVKIYVTVKKTGKSGECSVDIVEW